MSAVLGTGLVGAIAIVNLAFGYVTFASESGDAAAEIRVGMSREAVTALIGDDDPFVHLAARPVEPSRQPDTQCVYQLSGDTEPASRAWPVRRYCFRQDRLVEVSDFDLPDPGN